MDDATLGGGIDRSIPPGSGRRRSPAFTKGRQLDDNALQDVQALLEGEALRRDRLIEYLHLIQDSYGSLSASHLQALGQAMGIPMAAVYEVASFYAHFDIVLDGEEAPPPITVRVCDSITCEMMGAKALLHELPEILGPGVRVLPAPCMGRCACAPTGEVGHRHIDAATTETIAEAVATKETHPVIADYKDLTAYQAGGGYDLLRACLKGERSADEIISILSDSNLRGLGGAGFPAGRKWSIVRDQPGPRLMTINGDEGEPGTFKDRIYLEQDPHRFLEGTLIAAWAVGCEKAYI